MGIIVIKNGRVVDPASGMDQIADVIIKDDLIQEIIQRPEITRQSEITQQPVAGAAIEKGADHYQGMAAAKYLDVTDAEIIDGSGLIVAPGLVDVHVHFREPGFTDKEDIETGALAAARGGFTTVVLMANTNPPADQPEILQYVLDKGKKTGIHIESCGTVTQGMQGEELTDMTALSAAGAAGFTDDGRPLLSEAVVRKAMVQAAAVGKPLSFHEEDPAFIQDNGVNAGPTAARLGLAGSAGKAEIEMVRRDLDLAAETGATVCFQHISTKEAVALIREKKKTLTNIHAEATPHHFTLTEEAVIHHGTLAKMNPPLRTEEDRRAIIAGLQDGTLDIIATDHAPHTRQEKEQPLAEAPSGIIGLETALSLGLRELVGPGHLTMGELITRMSLAPARLYQLPAGEIRPGAKADVVIFDPNKTWRVEGFVSKAANSPFLGEELPGVVYATICEGKIVYRLQDA